MAAFFSKFSEDFRHERSLKFLSSSTDSDKLQQSGFLASEWERMKNLAPERLHRQKSLKDYVALVFSDVFFFNKWLIQI